MNKITCRNGFVFVAAICLGLMVSSAPGGSLDAPAGPTDPASAMYTLQDIYNYLTMGVRASKRIGGFTEPTAGPTVGTMHTLNEIMEAGIIPQKTGQTNTWAVGDDGTNRIGRAWPNPWFTAVASSGAETNQIRDNLTGLIWARNANMFGGPTNWGAAVTNCNNLNTNTPLYGGTNDWRLPNRWELESLLNLGVASASVWLNSQGFTGILSEHYWSSTTSAAGTDSAWSMQLGNGHVDVSTKVTAFYVWPVRGGR